MVKEKVFIHVGLPKTGTTFLQTILFPKLVLKNKKIITSEALCSQWNYPVSHRKYLMYGLKHMYPDASIIIGIRDKNTWLKSMYNQVVKRGVTTLGFKEWVDTIDPELLDFNGYVADLKKTFKNVFVYHFEEFCINKIGIIIRLCDFIGCEVPVYNDEIVNWSYYGFKEKIILFFNKTVNGIRFVMLNLFRVVK